MLKPRKKKRPPKRVLALPDLEQSKTSVLNSLTSKSGQRSYDRAITDSVDCYCSEPRLAFNRAVVLRYRIYLEQKQYAATTINLRLAAVRRVALTVAQTKRLLAAADRDSLRGKRDYAMIAMLTGCGLRRGELPALRVDSIAGHIRTVPIPSWVKIAIDEWKEASHITECVLFRSIDMTGRVWGTGMTPKCCVRWFGLPRRVSESKNSHPMIFDTVARGYAILRAANWIRSNFCSDTFQYRRRNATSAANRNCGLPLTTEWVSNHRMSIRAKR